MAIRSGSGASAISGARMRSADPRKGQELRRLARSEPPSIQQQSQGKQVGKIYSLELAKARKVNMEQEEKDRKDRQTNFKARLEQRMIEREEEMKNEEEQKLQFYAEKQLRREKKALLCAEMKKLSKGKKRLCVAKVTVKPKEVVTPAIETSLLGSSAALSGGSAEIGGIESPRLRNVFEHELPPASTNEGIKAVQQARIMKKAMEKNEMDRKARLKAAQQRIAERMKIRKEEERKETEKKRVLHYGKLKPRVAAIPAIPTIPAVPTFPAISAIAPLIIYPQIPFLEFGYYYAASFLETMRALEEEETFYEDESLDSDLDSFNAPQWVDLTTIEESIDDDVAFFCRTDCGHSHALIFPQELN